MQMPHFTSGFWEKLQKLIELNRRDEALYYEKIDEYTEEVTVHRRKVQNEVMPEIVPFIELLVAAGVIRVRCSDDEDNYLVFKPHAVSIYFNGADCLLDCRKIVGSTAKLPKFEW